MRFVSWNVNGLRAWVKKGFEETFYALNADVFCLQETKLQAGQIESVRLLRDGSELPIVHDWITDNYGDLPYVTLGPDPHLPDPIDTVLDVTLRD